MEFKNTQVIHWEDFKEAVTSPGGARAKRDGALGREQLTYFKKNALWLSKQARKYYATVGTPDIAVFDWHTMFVFNFDGFDEGALNPALVEGTWFTEAGKNPSQGNTFRMVLYGFLIRALMRLSIIT
jgi:hypothetical protein